MSCRVARRFADSALKRGIEWATVGGDYVILDGFIETPDTWADSVIALTFGEWLERMLAAFVESRAI